MRRKIADHYSDKWRIAGDLGLALIPTCQLTVINAPNLNDIQKYWIGFVCTTALIIFKFITKTQQK